MRPKGSLRGLYWQEILRGLANGKAVKFAEELAAGGWGGESCMTT